MDIKFEAVDIRLGVLLLTDAKVETTVNGYLKITHGALPHLNLIGSQIPSIMVKAHAEYGPCHLVNDGGEHGGGTWDLYFESMRNIEHSEFYKLPEKRTR